MGAPAVRFRWLFVCGGVACVALGAVGAVVPGIPTTEFVLAGSYLLTRGSPAFERRLRRSALFAPWVRYLDPAVPLPRRARLVALAGMWAWVGLSAAVLGMSGGGAIGIVAMLVAGAASTWMILAFRNGRRSRRLEPHAGMPAAGAPACE